MPRNLLTAAMFLPMLLGAWLTFAADVKPAIDRDLVVGLARPGELDAYDDDNTLVSLPEPVEVAEQ